MLRRLTIKNRSPTELWQLAAERRELATSKTGRVRELLLNEARLLEFQSELKAWMRDSNRDLADRRTRRIASEENGLLPSLSLLTAVPLAARDVLYNQVSGLKLAKKHALLSEQDAAARDLLILCSGMAKAVCTLEDGRQTITSIFVAGDTMNATDVALGRTRTAIEALSPVTYLSLGREKLENTMREHPSVAHALWQETAMYSARQQEWAISWGRRAADRRLAHFLCEVAFR